MNRIKVKTYINTEFDFGTKKIKLENSQYNVVKCDIKKNIRIVACAGSGKTTTILCRVKYLIDNHVDSSRIMLTTFNIDAANTLKTRLKNLVNNNKVKIGTFDSICASFYYKYFKTDGYVGVNEYNNLLIKYLNSENGHNILNQYDYIFFDEYQDINNEQFQVIQKFYLNGTYIIGIGDDSQNIYQWRGSNIDYILNFDKYFDNVVTFKLENNFRSTPEIINLANAIIKNNSDQIDKNMLPNNPSGKLPIICKFSNQTEQALSIINQINQIKKLKDTINLSDIIVISRNNFGLKIFEEQLEIYNNKHKDSNEKIEYIAMITDNEKDKKQDSNIYLNRLVLATIHKIKGCEYSHVFIIDADDKIFPADCDSISIQEERRLLYVAITRAKIFLQISFCTGKICRFFSEISPQLFMFENFKKSYFEINDKRTYKQTFMIGELVHKLKNTDYDYIRTNKIMFQFTPSEHRIHSQNNINNDINTNNLMSDYGAYIDTFICHTFGSLNNTLAKCILNPIILDHYQYSLYLSCNLKEYFLMYDFDLPPIIETFQFPQKKLDQILVIVHKIINQAKKINVTPFEIYVTKNGFLPVDFINKLQKSYNLYSSKSKVSLNDIYNISLCPNIYQNRRRLLYKDCFDIFNQNTKVYTDIHDFYSKYSKNNITIKKVCISSEKSLYGVVDLYNESLYKITDFRPSNSEIIQIQWFIELLCCCALLRKKKYRVDYISIYNPFTGIEYEINVTQWNKEEEIINVLIKNREETETTNMCDVTKKYVKKNNFEPTKKIKDICFDFGDSDINNIIDDNVINAYNDMKNSMTKYTKKNKYKK